MVLNSVEEMKDVLIDFYGEIPRGSLEAYELLVLKAGIRSDKITYEEKKKKHENICKILGFRAEGALAGRDVDNY
jgi:hypothetical protein